MMDTMLIEGEYYWLHAQAVEPADPIMIGQYLAPGWWHIDGRNYNEGPGIQPIELIERPKL